MIWIGQLCTSRNILLITQLNFVILIKFFHIYRSLQTAVGCYLDFCSLQSLPSMKIVQEKQVNAQQQAFQLQNDGTERWPNNCYLTSPIQTQRINVPALRPGETCDILADMMPTQPPTMWRLCTSNGWYFGGEQETALDLRTRIKRWASKPELLHVI